MRLVFKRRHESFDAYLFFIDELGMGVAGTAEPTVARNLARLIFSIDELKQKYYFLLTAIGGKLGVLINVTNNTILYSKLKHLILFILTWPIRTSGLP